MVNFNAVFYTNTENKGKKKKIPVTCSSCFYLITEFFEQSAIIWKYYLCISVLPEGFLTPIFQELSYLYYYRQFVDKYVSVSPDETSYYF